MLFVYATLGSFPLIATATNFTNLPAEQGIDPLKTWTITFSQPIGNVQNASVFDTNGNRVPTTTTVTGAQVKIAPPHGGYRYGETYTLLLSDLYDITGKKIDVAKRLDFTITTMYQPKVINDVVGTNLIINGSRYRTNVKYHSFIRANATALQNATVIGIIEDGYVESITELKINTANALNFNGFNHYFERLTLEGPFASIKDVSAHDLHIDQAHMLERVTVTNNLDITSTALTTNMIIQSSEINQLRNYQDAVTITTYRSSIKHAQAFANFSFYYDGPTMETLRLYAYDFQLRGRFDHVSLPFSQRTTQIKAKNEADVQIKQLHHYRSGPLQLTNTVRVNDFFMYDDETKIQLDDLSHIKMLHLPKDSKVENVIISYPHFKGNVADYTKFYAFEVQRSSAGFGYFTIAYQTDAEDYTVYYEAYPTDGALPKLRDNLPKQATVYTGQRISYEPGKQYAFYLVQDKKIIQMDTTLLNEVDFPWYDILLTNNTVTLRFAETIKPSQLQEVRLYHSATNHTTYADFTQAVWGLKDGKTQVTFTAENLKPRHLYYGFSVITTQHTSGEVFQSTSQFNATALYQSLGDHYSMRLALLTLLDGDAIVKDSPQLLARYATALQTTKRVTTQAELWQLIATQNNN